MNTPFYRILCSGEDVTEKYDGKLLSLTVIDQTNEQSDSLQIELADPGWTHTLPDKSYQLEIILGYDGKPLLDRLFIVDEVTIEGSPDKITICGKACPCNASAALLPMQARKTRSFDGVTLAEIARTIAAENGLNPAVDPFFDTITEHIDQTDESDNSLLARLARDYDAVYTPATGKKSANDATPGNYLVFAQASSGLSASGLALPIVTVDRIKDNIRPGWRAVVSVRTQFSACKRKYHDPETGQTHEATAGSGSKVLTIQQPARNQSHAHCSARSTLKSLLRGSQNVVVEMPARFDIQSEQFVTLANFHPSINNVQWLAKVVEHRLTKGGGMTTRLGLEIATPKTSTSSSSSGNGPDFGETPSADYNADSDTADAPQEDDQS